MSKMDKHIFNQHYYRISKKQALGAFDKARVNLTASQEKSLSLNETQFYSYLLHQRENLAKPNLKLVIHSQKKVVIIMRKSLENLKN